MIKRLAIIPARIGSKRIKQKNIKKIGSKTLIESTLDVLKKSNLFHTIHVSTDSIKIKKFTERKKLLVDFMRPKSLAGDKIPVSDVINFVIKSFKRMDINFDEIWLIYASNPFLSIKHIKKGYKLYKQNRGKFSIMTVSNYNYPINWALSLGKKNDLKLIGNKFNLKSKKIVCEAGMFIIYQKQFIKNNKNLKYKGYEIPIWDTIDIDTMDDFIMAKKLLK